MKRMLALLIVCAVIITGLIPPAYAEDNPTVLTVSFPQSDGINEIYEDGSYGGITYDWLNEIAKYTGWKYEFITEFNDNLDDLSKADLIGGMYHYDGADELYFYPDYVMGHSYSLLTASKNGDIKSYDLTTLQGKKIAVNSHAQAKIKRLENFLAFNGISCEIVSYDGQEDAEHAFDSGLVDMVFISDLWLNEERNVIARVETDPYYLVTTSDDPEIRQQLNEAISKIYTADPHFAEKLYEKYYDTTFINNMVISSEERRFIAENKTLTVAVSTDSSPVYSETSIGAQGIAVSYFNLISDRTGIQFKFVVAGNYEKAIEMVKSGDADLLGFYVDDEYAAVSDGLTVTTAPLMLDNVILRNKNSTGKENSYVAATWRGDTVEKNPDLEISEYIFYDTFGDCLNAVENNEVDLLKMPMAYTELLFTENYYINIVMSVTDDTTPLSIAMKSGSDPNLYSVLNKAANNISSEELHSLVAENTFFIDRSAFTIKGLIYTNPVGFVFVTALFIMLGFLVLLLSQRYIMRSHVLKLRAEKAEAGEKAKSEFLSRMSHEIRTPLNAIIVIAQMAREETQSYSVAQSLTEIEDSGNYLLGLMNDILDVSRMESGKFQLQPEWSNLGEVIASCVAMIEPMMNKKNIRFLFPQIMNELKPYQAYVDPLRLRQVLINLLNNAYKFTPSGGTVHFEYKNLSVDKENQICTELITIRDTGCGMSQDFLKRLGEPFSQERNADTKAIPGTGLGITVVKQIVTAMNGKFNVDSTEGRGTVFEITFSYRYRLKADAPANTLPQTDSLRGRHVLLVEDIEINAMIATRLLNKKGVIVERASDGAQAVKMFLETLPDYYDAILMDIRMPIMDGYKATAQIRTSARPDAATVPIIAMTANAMSSDIEDAKKAGMNAHLAKPIDPNLLYELLSMAIGE